MNGLEITGYKNTIYVVMNDYASEINKPSVHVVKSEVKSVGVSTVVDNNGDVVSISIGDGHLEITHLDPAPNDDVMVVKTIAGAAPTDAADLVSKIADMLNL